MPINFNLDAANVGLEVSETINTDRGDIVRMVRLSKTRTMLVGPSLPEGTTVIWENPPDDVSEITVGEAWAKAKKIASHSSSAVKNAQVMGEKWPQFIRNAKRAKLQKKLTTATTRKRPKCGLAVKRSVRRWRKKRPPSRTSALLSPLCRGANWK